MRIILSIIIAFGLAITSAISKEAWCTSNPSNCVCSEDFQSTTYTEVGNDTVSAFCLGDQTGDKPCRYTDYLAGDPYSFMMIGTTGYNGTTDCTSKMTISTDATLLADLNNGVGSVARFLRHTAANFTGYSGSQPEMRFGYDPIDLTGVKRISIRFYSYHSSDYQWASDGSCTNGKLAHNNATNYNPPYPTITYPSSTAGGGQMYVFRDEEYNWDGHANFEGFYFGPEAPGNTFIVGDQRNRWYRHEVIIRRPRQSDSAGLGLGYDMEYWTTNISDGGVTQAALKLSAGCTGCMAFGGTGTGNDFAWDTSFHPLTVDLPALYTELFREGTTCNGWQGWAYATVAKWTTDDCTGITCNGGSGFPTSGQTGPMIGPATEVEAGGAPIAGSSFSGAVIRGGTVK